MNQDPSQLIDQHGRRKRKLRISLTDRCNFRCSYCMPDHPQWLPKKQLLSFEEIVRVARLMIGQGISHIRLTGGEPLLRRDLVSCVAALHALRSEGLEQLSMTSNASLLAPQAQALKAAGLDDLNISLDSIQPETFKRMTGRELAPVLQGIEAARAAGLGVKINSVLLRKDNADQILPLIHWARGEGLELRFIEYMPLDMPGRWQRAQVVSEDEIIAAVAAQHRVEALPRSHDPATRYRIDGEYELGVISTVSKPFCASCDRLRLTATGELYTCLFAQSGTPLRELLRADAGDAQLLEIIRTAVWHKDVGYAARQGPVERPVTMHMLGG
ncbi:cyclic pyranopterin phosphate synthase [Solimonas aquatica]|uniref:GTP 3',8-cyclase n=1 Tax=Solimonas aquatica TaxID=489703 RepID=A0A1H9D3X3_9GAMM|nr:GTP 3',8-cyclase MoaA [Solimonas aquatica]SEQ08186.1 cyclic pyranopterin phosphate synthase [Solimonas aquatica]